MKRAVPGPPSLPAAKDEAEGEVKGDSESKDNGTAMESLYSCAIRVLRTGDVSEKARLTKEFVHRWNSRQLTLVVAPDPAFRPLIPDYPAHELPKVAPGDSGTHSGSKKLAKFIHGVAHAEGYAIDLMWDLMARFQVGQLPTEFYDDWVKVAGEEAAHFESWTQRLSELTGAGYGSFPVHDGLWQSALDTKDDLLSRLAVVHGVHEARGLDVYTKAYARLHDARDTRSLAILEKNYREEIGHVSAAVKWFARLCGEASPEACFHTLVRKHYNGLLIPPFNIAARDAAGMTPDWYLPLANAVVAESS